MVQPVWTNFGSFLNIKSLPTLDPEIPLLVRNEVLYSQNDL